MKKKQPKKAPPATDTFAAKVPVKITLLHGETIMSEYEDVIEVEFTENTDDGKRNIS